MTALSDITVTITDARRSGYCSRGVRQWWPRQAYSMSFAEFLKTGMTADQFIAGGDSHAQRTVDDKIEREGIIVDG